MQLIIEVAKLPEISVEVVDHPPRMEQLSYLVVGTDRVVELRQRVAQTSGLRMPADVVVLAHDLGMTNDSRAERWRCDYAVERIETVPMTAAQYEQAVNALARLIVEWTTSPAGLAAGQLVIQAGIDHPPPWARFARWTVRLG
jgi:hypothetical protein